MFVVKSVKRSAQAQELRRDAIVDHALDLADREGLDAVAIRRIAADFSVTPMALYWHVKNKDELLDAMGDRIFESLGPSDASAPWLDQVREAVSALVTALRVHPASVELAYRRILSSPHGRALSEQVLKALRDAGFSVRQAADLARLALQTAVSLVSGMPGAELDVPEPEREAMTAGKKAALEQLPTGAFPNLIECAVALTTCDDQELYYGGGIDLYIAGVAGLATRLPSAVPA